MSAEGDTKVDAGGADTTRPPHLCSFYDDGLDPEDQYDPEAELLAGDEAEMDGNQGIVDGNDPSGLTGETANRERITTPYMTKYERARILGTRALQIRYVVACEVWAVCGIVLTCPHSSTFANTA